MKRVLAGMVLFFMGISFGSGVLFSENGVTDKEILIGSSLALEGAASSLGVQTNYGMTTCINNVNDNGGVNGRLIKLVTLNDDYEPEKCLKNTHKLIKENRVFALTCYVGTPTAVNAMPAWTEAKVPMVGFYTGAEALRVPFNRYNFHVRASYNEEIALAMDVLVKKLKLKKVAIFYQNDSFGEAIKKGAELVLKKNSLSPVAYGSFERNTLNIEEGLNKIKVSNPEVVVMAGTYAPLAKFVIEAKKAGLNKTIFYTVSFVGPEAYAQMLEKNSDKCMVTLVMPPYSYATEMPIVKEYITNLKKYYPGLKPNFVSFEGYVNACVLVEGLKRAGATLTRESFIEALETIKAGQLGTGFKIEYSQNDHQGSSKVYVTKIQNGFYYEVSDGNDLLK